MDAPFPADERQRLEALRRYQILDTKPEDAFDDFTYLASHIFQTPMAVISLVDQNRQWFKARLGLPVSETPRSISFCAHAILQPEKVLVVSDATKDARFKDNPAVTDDPNVRFYAGAPLITPDGFPLGTICTIDRTPRQVTAEQVDALERLARQIVAQLELRRMRLELEARVQERTRELASTVRVLEKEVQERIRAQQRLAALLARDRAIADSLQQALLLMPREDAFAHLRVCSFYAAASTAGTTGTTVSTVTTNTTGPTPIGRQAEPADESAESPVLVGGDFCDAFSHGDHQVLLVVGDVCGKGLDAAGITAWIKAAVRAFASDDPSPSSILNRLNRFLCQARRDGNPFLANQNGAFVTLALARVGTGPSEGVTSSSGTVEVSLAGAEPPLLIGADGSRISLAAGGLPLGIDDTVSSAAYETTIVDFRVGDTLLLFTDGLTEARKGNRPGSGHTLRLLGYEAVAEIAQAALTRPSAFQTEFQVLPVGAEVTDATQKGSSLLSAAGQNILSAVRAFADGRLQDDACLLMVQRTQG